MADDIQNAWGAQAIDVEQLARRYQNVVLNGCAVTDGSGTLEHDIAAGDVVVAGTEHAVSSSTVTLSSSSSNPRKDIIYIDSTGSATVAQGTADTARPDAETRRDTYRPRPPDLSGTDAVPLAEVWVAANASDTATADISDRRLFADAIFNDLTAVSSFTLQDAVMDSDWYFEVMGGKVADGDAGPVWTTTLANNETLNVTQASLVNDDTSAVPSNVDLIIADLTNGVSETTLITGDGTLKDDQTGSPLGSYQNTSGSDEQVGVLMDNGHFNAGSGSAQLLVGGFVGRVT